jgi:hypothetical protein
MWYIYKMGFHAAIRKNETMWFAGRWMQLEDIRLSEVSEAQKDKGRMCEIDKIHIQAILQVAFSRKFKNRNVSQRCHFQSNSKYKGYKKQT